MLFVVLTAVGFLFGVTAGTLSAWVLPTWVFFVGALGFVWRPRWGAIFLAFLLGYGRVELFERELPRLSMATTESLEGTLLEDWGVKGARWTWVVDTKEGLVLAQLSAYEGFEYGDTVLLKGLVEAPEAMDDGDLSYVHYLARHGIGLLMKTPYVERATPGGFSMLRGLSSLSDFLSDRLQALLPEPEASLAVGLLLGKRSQMDQALQDAFRAVGLTHIVAISGSNIALVVATFFLMFSFLPFRQRLFWSGVGVVVFVALVGPSAAVLRAGVMGLLSLLGLYTGRRSQAFFGLLWSAVLMVALSPYILVYDIGFDLSFASTLGILTLVPIFDEWIPKCSGKAAWILELREALLLTLAAQVTTFPFMAFYFGQISWITPFSNLLVAPLIPAAMAFSAFTLLFGVPAAAVAWFFLMGIEKIALVLSQIPGVQISVTVSPALFIIMLLALAFLLLLSYKSKLVRAFRRGSVGFLPKGSSRGS